jgi:hypothetical protein
LIFPLFQVGSDVKICHEGEPSFRVGTRPRRLLNQGLLRPFYLEAPDGKKDPFSEKQKAVVLTVLCGCLVHAGVAAMAIGAYSLLTISLAVYLAGGPYLFDLLRTKGRELIG